MQATKLAASAVIAKPPSVEYSDNILFGARREARKLRENDKLDNESDCALFAIGTYASKRPWSMKTLINNDKRLRSMFEHLEIKHAFTIQRHSWPLLHDPNFPLLCISPDLTGKTYAHLLYIVAQSITSVAVSKTDEILMNSEQSIVNQFELTNKSKLKSSSSILEKEIDYDNFDFNQIYNGTNQLKVSDSNNNKSESDNEQKTSSDEQVEDESRPKNSDGWTCEEADLDEFITHPKYIIVCSSQINVERVVSELENMKQAAYSGKASSAQRRNLPPCNRSINVHLTDDTLALRCNESEILVGTPAALLRCFANGYLNFAKCHKFIFDDLDVTLQLHNANVSKLVNLFLDRDQQPNLANTRKQECQIYMFSKKWTRLVKACVEYLSKQRVLLFGSLLEASIFTNVRFNLELYSRDAEILNKLHELLRTLESQPKAGHSIAAIVCRNNQEAIAIYDGLISLGHRVIHLPHDTDLKLPSPLKSTSTNNIYVMSDAVLELVADSLNNVCHIIHVTLPNKFIRFDQRFRLMYRNINDRKTDLNATVFIGPKLGNKYAKELYDLLSRSSNTLTSTKLEFRDRIRQYATQICWRWATTGVCKLGQSTRGGKSIDDRLGLYCPYKHSTTINCVEKLVDRVWPSKGQVRLTITEIVSPNEFYFWFESYRDADSLDRQWTRFESSGLEHMREFQIDLDTLKDVPPNTVDLALVKRGAVFGIYQQQELRVDRVMLLEDLIDPEDEDYTQTECTFKYLNKKLEMSKILEVFKIDYGVRQTARVSNLITLPERLKRAPPKCHRGFLIGLKPTDGESDWLYSATKRFHELVSQNGLNDITAWLRLSSDSCFWFENLVVTWRIKFPDETKLFKTEPQKELTLEGLAEETKSVPDCLNPSTYLYTISKWNAINIAAYANYAKPPQKLDLVPMMILFVESDLTLKVRQAKFNKQLLNLEDELINDYNSNKLQPMEYFEIGHYCLARTVIRIDPQTKEPQYILNRCKLTDTFEEDGEQFFQVDCLDHGDQQIVKREDLFQASILHLSILPFQSFSCEIANLNQDLLNNNRTLSMVQNIIYDETRDADNNYLSTSCLFSCYGQVKNIYVKSVNTARLVSLIKKFETLYGIELVTDKDPALRIDCEEVVNDNDCEVDLAHTRDPRPTDILLTYMLKQIALEEYEVACKA